MEKPLNKLLLLIANAKRKFCFFPHAQKENTEPTQTRVFKVAEASAQGETLNTLVPSDLHPIKHLQEGFSKPFW